MSTEGELRQWVNTTGDVGADTLANLDVDETAQVGFISELIGKTKVAAESDEEVITGEKDEDESEDEDEVKTEAQDEETSAEDEAETKDKSKAEAVGDESPVDAILADNEFLRQQIINIAMGRVPTKENVADTSKQESSTQVKPQQQDGVLPKLDDIKVEDLLTSDEKDRILDQPELIGVAMQRGFNLFANQIVQKLAPLINDVKSQAANVATHVTSTMESQRTFRAISEQFYKQNQDLHPYIEFLNFNLRRVRDEVLNGAIKDMPLDKAYEEAGRRVREALKLPKIAASGNKTRTGLAKSGSSGRNAISRKSTGTASKKSQRDMMTDLIRS